MTSVLLTDSASAIAADVVVVATVSTPRGIAVVPGAGRVDSAFGGGLLAALRAVEASGRIDEVCKIPTLGTGPAPLVLAAGLGATSAAAPDTEAVRQGVGAALRSMNTAKRVLIAIGDGTDPALVTAICEGALLGGYRFTRYKSAAKPIALRRIEIAVAEPGDPAAKAALRRSKIVADAVNNARDLVNTPPNVLNPVSFADYALASGEAAGLTVEVFDEKDLLRDGYGAILAVGGGSATPPRMVRLSYTPTRARTSVALVGKGITFDSGGLDLKSGAGMAAMKSDMGGAAAVIETVIAAAKLRLPIAVTATVPMAENVVSGTSYRPSDVLRLHDGRTVEVDNTDAEGRLILADAMLRACEDAPDYLIDTATLTGGQVVALGDYTVGAMGTPAFRDRVVAAGNAAGESLWAMPLEDNLRPRLDSPVADIVNLPVDRWASMLVAAAFLKDFVADGVDWVHLDIAGPAFLNAATGYQHRGGTGYIVRTMLATLTELAAD